MSEFCADDELEGRALKAKSTSCRCCLGFVYGFAVAGLLGLAAVIAHGASEYRRGQIDAINGVVKYELHAHDDGTTSWEVINE